MLKMNTGDEWPAMIVASLKFARRRLLGWQRCLGQKKMRFGSFRRLTPVSRVFGLDRGQPIDRYYIEGFLTQHANDIRGRTLEIADRTYTVRFGGSRVTQSDVLHATPDNANATLVGDLTTGAGIPPAVFDCMILTQVLPFIYEIGEAVKQIRNALRPGGTALLTVPGISQISRYDMDRWGDYWRFTDASVRRLFCDVFGSENVTIVTYGNVLAACAFLHGLTAHELKTEELDYNDSDYQVVIGVHAKRPMEN